MLQGCLVRCRLLINSPHIRYANANTDEKLLEFVQDFGPVVASSVHEEGVEAAIHALVADQDLRELRSEQVLYRSALTLLSEVMQGTRANVSTIQQNLAAITDKVSQWPAQWRREQQARQHAGELSPHWEFGVASLRYIQRVECANRKKPDGDNLSALFALYDPLRGGHQVLCELVNAFRPLVYVWGNSAIEAPYLDLRYGIRPILYHILRREYLDGAGVAVCSNIHCRNLFDIERAGQRFCEETCSRRQRQREYWRERGKKLRKKRAQRPQNRAAKGR